MNARIPSALFLFFILGLSANSLLAQDPDSWEDRQTRLQPPYLVIPAIGLEEGMVVGEIGAGRGRYSVILAGHVGDQGHIYANDINKEDLEYLEFRIKRDGIKNLSIILGEELDPLLPEDKLDMLFIVNSYHHFSQPVSLLKNAYPALKNSGTLAIIEGVPGRGYSGHSTPQKEIIKQMEQAGYQFAPAAGTFKILLEKFTDQFKPHFALESFRVTIEKDKDQPCSAHATIKIRVGDKKEITAGEGYGPVSALDNALRKALDKFYPDLDTMRLVDFKVRVIDGTRGTAAKVRVLIESRDQHEIWSTMGVSEDIIEASWQALADSFQFKLDNEERIRLENSA